MKLAAMVPAIFAKTMKRNLNRTCPENGYKSHPLYDHSSISRMKLYSSAEADAVEYIASMLWNCLFGWLIEVDYPRCRFVADIGIGRSYQCELDCDHDGPHIYDNGSCRWYSREMPNWRENNLSMLFGKAIRRR